MEDRNVKHVALEQEEAAKLTAGTRDHGMGAAALGEMRRAAEAMAKLRVSGGQTGLRPAPTDGNAAQPPAESPRPVPPLSCRRAALYHALRK